MPPASNKQISYKNNRTLIKRLSKLNVKLDKISITIPLSEASNSASAFYSVFNDKDNAGLKIQRTYSGAYIYSYKIYILDEHKKTTKDDHILLQILPRRKSSNSMRIEFNPEKISPQKSAEIDVLMECCCGYSFQEIISLGTVTRVDLCVDVIGRDINNYIFDIPYKSKIGMYAFKGVLETAYLGNMNAGGICAYQKSKQDPSFTKKTVRFETRLRCRMPVAYLHRINNPFSKLVIYKISSASNELEGVEKYHFLWFISHCRIHGLKYVVRNTPRKIISPYLELIGKKKYVLFDGVLWERALIKALQSYDLYMIQGSGGVVSQKKAA